MIRNSKPIAYLCRSSAGKEKLFDCAKKVKEPNFVQLFKNRKEVKERLLAAYLNVLVRKEENIMRSKSPAIELLLFVSGEMNISKAIKEFGISGGDFIVFATSEKSAEEFIECSGSEKIEKLELEFDRKESARVAVSELIED